MKRIGIVKIKFISIFILILTIQSYSQDKIVNVKKGEWLQTWYLCGPIPLKPAVSLALDKEHLEGFDKDYLKELGGEKKPNIRKGDKVKFQNGSATWLKHTTQDHIINLKKIIGDYEYALSYAYCEITAPAEKTYFMAFGTDDGARIFFNGEQVWDSPKRSSLKIDDHLIPVTMKKGRNTLLFKIENFSGNWNFCARFLEYKPKEYLDQVKKNELFKLLIKENGQADLLFTHSPSLFKYIFNKATIHLFKAKDLKQTILSHTWHNQQKLVVVADSTDNDRYLLSLEARLINGKKWIKDFQFEAGTYNWYHLFANRRTKYKIVIGENASESEQWAAQELRYWLKEISGVDFPFINDKKSVGKHEIIIGFNRHTRTLLPHVEEPKENDESFIYQNIGSNISILGGKARGTMYGVMTFLERELGCRWYTPEVSLIPKKEKWSFHKLNHSELPGILVRNTFYHHAFDPIWSARNKNNGAMNYRKQPGGIEAFWDVHTLTKLVSPSEFAQTHPEYFGLYEGKRRFDESGCQLCLSNPDVLKIVKERIKEVIRKEPYYLIYSVSQNDNSNPCQCENCQAIVKKEGSEAGLMLWFVNQVAEEIEKEFPDKYIGTLAYRYTRKPPKITKPRKNVVIRFCSIECCFAHDFTSCPENEAFIADLEGWAEIAPKMYVWDYVVNFSHYIMPFPNFKVLQPNIQTFRKNNVIGIMEQAAYQGRGGEFAKLRAYVISKLLWNPDCDVDAVINDFMYGYYGKSGQYVRAYFDLLHSQITPETHFYIYDQPEHPLFSEIFIQQAEMLFDKAEAVAENPEILRRVQVTRLPVLYLKCRRTPYVAKYDGTYQRFCEIANREGIIYYSEKGEPQKQSFHALMDMIGK